MFTCSLLPGVSCHDFFCCCFLRQAAASLTVNSQSQQNKSSLDCSLLCVVNKRRHKNSDNMIQRDIEPLFKICKYSTIVNTSFEVGMGKKCIIFGTWLDNIDHLRYL